MVTPAEFEQGFKQYYDALNTLLDFTRQPPLQSVPDVLSLTVNEFLTVVENAKQAAIDIPTEEIEEILRYPDFTLQFFGVGPAEKAFLEALAAEDYDAAFAPFDSIVGLIDTSNPDLTLQSVLSPNEGETGGDTGGQTGGDTGGQTGGDTGGQTGGDTGGQTGGDTGGQTGGDTGGQTGGDTGGQTGGDTGGQTGGDTGGQTGAADQEFFGSSTDEKFNGGTGNDLIDGGSGIDTAAYSGNQSSYTVQVSPSGITITDRRPSQDGTDTLVSIENLEFADGDFNLGTRLSAGDATAEDIAAIVELYIAYFDRSPAAKGLLYWVDQLLDGLSIPQIAQSFFEQSEVFRTYEAFLNEDGSLADTEAFVTAVFNNVLGRDPSGPYWINELDNNPAITPPIFILSVLNGAKAPTGGEGDRAYLADKTDIGIYFSAIKGLAEFEDTVAVMQLYDGSQTSVINAVAAIDQIHADALDPNNGEFLMPLVGVIDNPFA